MTKQPTSRKKFPIVVVILSLCLLSLLGLFYLSNRGTDDDGDPSKGSSGGPDNSNPEIPAIIPTSSSSADDESDATLMQRVGNTCTYVRNKCTIWTTYAWNTIATRIKGTGQYCKENPAIAIGAIAIGAIAIGAIGYWGYSLLGY